MNVSLFPVNIIFILIKIRYIVRTSTDFEETRISDQLPMINMTSRLLFTLALIITHPLNLTLLKFIPEN